MRLIITENQHNKLRIVKKSDLDDSGTWSADVLTHKSEDRKSVV
jgi:hypothetical protein